MKTWKIVFVVVLVSLVGFGIFPLKKKVAKLRTENSKLLQTKKEKVAELKELQSGLKDGKKDGLIDPEIRIPRNLDQTELLIDLQRIASQTNIILPNNWSFNVSEDKDLNITKLEVSFPIKGSRGGIYKFLQLLEKNERFLAVQGLSISSTKEDGVPVLEMPISLEAYSQEKIEK